MPTPQPSDGLPAVDPNLIYSNPDEYHRQMEARTEARIQKAISGAAGSVSAPLASMAKAQARTHRPDIWDRYGPEIETTMASMPSEARANVETWRRVVNYVAGEHVDEIARAKAEELIRSGADSGMLSTQAGSPLDPGRASTRNPIEKLFDEGHPAVKGFVDDGIPVSKVVQHARDRGYTDLQAYADMLTARVKTGAHR